MISARDLSAIASWERAEQSPDPNDGPRSSPPYRCCGCAWTGRGAEALTHYRATGHALRGRSWPATWPDARWPEGVR